MTRNIILTVASLVLLLSACGGSEPTPIQPPTEAPVTSTPAPAPTPAATATEVPQAEPGAVTSLEGVQEATIQIEAQGTFSDPQGQETGDSGRGSGFIIDPSGIAVTNHHVVGGAALLKVWIGGESKTYNAKILGVSECSDLAVIDIEGDGFAYLEWYDGEIKPGLDIYAAGFPLGDPEYTLTRGIVSKARADGETGWASVDDVLVHDATINPGNSGGPLVTADGRVVGVNYRTRADANQYFAIAPEEALPLIEQLRAGKDVDSIGVNGEAIAFESGLNGVWVTSVEAGSIADSAGIQGGDIIVQLEGLDLASDGTLSDYCDIIRSHTLADTLNLQIVRFATEEVWEGQLNGRALELAFSFAQEARDDVAGETSSGEGSYSAYVRVDDDLGSIAMEVPAEWSDVDGSPWLDEGTTIGASLQASPNLDDFLVNSPGVMFLAGSLGGQDFDISNALDSFDFRDSCAVYGGRSDYADALYAGLYDYYTGCGDNGSVVFVVVATPEDRAFVTIVIVQAVTQADLEAADHILDTFEVVGELPGSGAAGSGSSGSAGSGDATLQMFNDTGETIYRLYISPSDSDSWGEDWLGQDVIDAGQSYKISGIASGTYDIRPENEDEEGLGTIFQLPLSGDLVFTFPGLADLPPNAVIELEETFPDSNENNWGQRGQGEYVDYYPPEDGQVCTEIKAQHRMAWDWYQPYQAAEFFAQVHCFLNPPDAQCGMGFGPDDANLYWFSLHPATQSFRLGLIQDGAWQDDPVAESGSLFIPPSGWIYMAISREGSTLSVYVNGVKIAEADGSLFPTGWIGIGGASQETVPVVVCHDDLTIWRLE